MKVALLLSVTKSMPVVLACASIDADDSGQEAESLSFLTYQHICLSWELDASPLLLQWGLAMQKHLG